MYKEYAPPEWLNPFVECIWLKKTEQAERNHIVLPDGCMDILYSSDGLTCDFHGLLSRHVIFDRRPVTTARIRRELGPFLFAPDQLDTPAAQTFYRWNILARCVSDFSGGSLHATDNAGTQE